MCRPSSHSPSAAGTKCYETLTVYNGVCQQGNCGRVNTACCKRGRRCGRGLMCDRSRTMQQYSDSGRCLRCGGDRQPGCSSTISFLFVSTWIRIHVWCTSALALVSVYEGVRHECGRDPDAPNVPRTVLQACSAQSVLLCPCRDGVRQWSCQAHKQWPQSLLPCTAGWQGGGSS